MSPSKEPPVDPPPEGEARNVPPEDRTRVVKEPAPGVRVRSSESIADDFRSLRTGLVLLGVVALLALGVAAWALLASDDNADKDRVGSLERRVQGANSELDRARAQRQRKTRQLERRLRTTSDESDIRKLNQRLRVVEGNALDAVDAASDSTRALSRIERRLNQISARLTTVENAQRRSGGP